MINVKNLPKDFDWKFYLETYPDLKRAGIITEQGAILHYLNHGFSEKRKYNISLIENKVNPTFNDFVEICKNLIRFLPKKYPKIDKNSNKKSLLVETRELDHNEFVIKNTIQKLGDGWGHIIYCHDTNYHQIKKICDEISSDIEIKLVNKKLTRNDYNNLLLDIHFWNEITCEKILIYQTDTFISKEFDDIFLDYDYIGSYWGEPHSKKIKDCLGFEDVGIGNGGLSLRSVNIVKKILKEYDIKSNKCLDDTLELLPEDTYFSFFFKKNYKIPSIQLANSFSSHCDGERDLIYNINTSSFGFHQPWMFFNNEKDLKELINKLFFLKTKKRILFVNHEESLTGAPKVLKNIIDYEINKDEYDVFVVTLSIVNDNWDIKNRFILSEIPGQNILDKSKYLSLILNPDIVYANTIISAKFAHYFECVKIIFLHEYMSLTPFIKNNNLQILKSFDKILVGCEKTKNLLSQYEIKSVLTPYYLNYDFIEKLELKKENQEFIVGMGYCQLRKGIHRFIEIAEKLPNENFLWIGSTDGVKFIDDKIVIVGDNYLLPDYNDEPIKQIKLELTIPKNLKFIGHVSENVLVTDFLTKSKCLLMLSTDDPFPIVSVLTKLLNINMVTLKESGDSYKLADKNDLVLDTYNKNIILNYVQNMKPNEIIINKKLHNELKNNLSINRDEYLNFLNKKIKVFLPIESNSSDFSYSLLEKSIKSLEQFNYDIKIITNKITERLIKIKSKTEIIVHDFEIANFVKDYYPNGDSRCFNGEKTNSISGSYFRLEVSNICVKMGYTDKYVLYCDSDIICNKDFSNLLNWDVKYFSASPEWEKNNLDYFNAGVLWINVKNMYEKYDEIKKFIFNNLPSLSTHDQQALNELFKSKKINNKTYFDYLDNRMNWKPYWGVTHDFYILHFHWLKPNMTLKEDNVQKHLKVTTDKIIDIDSVKYYFNFWDSYGSW